jgi:hypothetical protein
MTEIGPQTHWKVSADVVARDVAGDFVLVPIVGGIGDLDDELYCLNDSGREIWRRLDGTRSLGEIATELAGAYDAAPAEIEADVLGVVRELAARRLVVPVEGKG